MGLVRVALRPLRDHWCFFETVSVSLLPSPELDFALRLLGGGDVRTIPGLHEALEEMLRRRALSALTWPRAVGASISTRAKQAANVARAQRAARARAGAGGSGSAGKAGASSSLSRVRSTKASSALRFAILPSRSDIAAAHHALARKGGGGQTALKPRWSAHHHLQLQAKLSSWSHPSSNPACPRSRLFRRSRKLLCFFTQHPELFVLDIYFSRL